MSDLPPALCATCQVRGKVSFPLGRKRGAKTCETTKRFIGLRVPFSGLNLLLTPNSQLFIYLDRFVYCRPEIERRGRIHGKYCSTARLSGHARLRSHRSAFGPAHHLDLEFYDQFYEPGAYLRTHASHMERWHP